MQGTSGLKIVRTMLFVDFPSNITMLYLVKIPETLYYQQTLIYPGTQNCDTNALQKLVTSLRDTNKSAARRCSLGFSVVQILLNTA
jgi:hypothetical protein